MLYSKIEAKEPFDPGWLFRFNYDPTVIDKIKQLPTSGRKWIKEQKIWWIAPEYHQIVEKILSDPRYDPLNDLYGHNFGPGGANHLDPHFKTLHLDSEAPELVIRGVYKILMTLYHPTGGKEPDHKKMVEVNLAFEAICRAKQWRK